MLLRRHREASVKAPTPQVEMELNDQGDQGDQGDQCQSDTDQGDQGDDYAINYDELSYDALQEIAKKQGIPANLKKAELIEALKASE